VEGGGFFEEFLVESLGGLGGVKDEKTSGGGVLEDVIDELIVVDWTEVMTRDAVKGFEEGGFVVGDAGNLFRRKADGEIVAAVEGRLGGRAKDDGAVEVVDNAAQGAKDGMEERGGKGLDFVENDNTAGNAVQLAAGAGAVGEEGFEELNVGCDN